ncbi:S8 family serine peptidase [Mesorhizobium sp. LHD-90]|uniref:S8 family serine peptidase n=1 Tax=Mesorhizobium sp. LHD-90 TaxID=3071414 RepID=UPI0027DEB0CF|nr:S8 family serine peptidase [Mesorhizobium sp. LHD-90]MDQ6434786.1 S8 family serine peptidase [Mesorhizobium sp. LHD-90]
MAGVAKRLKRLAAALVALGVLAAILGETVPPLGAIAGAGMAFADDDDGDDGGGGGRRGARGDDDDRRPAVRLRAPRWLSPRRWFEPRRAAPRRAVQRGATPRRAPIPLQTRAEEIVAVGLTPAELERLTAAGFVVAERRQVALLGGDVFRLRAPTGQPLETALAEVRAASPQAAADFNHFYRPEQDNGCAGGHCASHLLVAWPAVSGAPACLGSVKVGLIDTAINPEHDAFAGGQVEVARIADAAPLPESARQHGTAVAALLVGAQNSRTPGLLPGARLVAVDAFHRGSGSDDRADVFTLVRAVDLLAGRGIDVVNLSLSGPDNALLARTVAAASDKGSVLVAAAGNNGPRAAPAYPAAYEAVIAVTAVDKAKRVYRRANQGDYVDLAAPGVEVWAAASVRGVRPKTGTSFAAPFVTAAAALIKAGDPEATPQVIAERLTRAAEDLGEPGRDPVFGWGLLDASGACGRAG